MKTDIYMRIYVEDEKSPTYTLTKGTDLPVLTKGYVVDHGIVWNSNITTKHGTPIQELILDYVHYGLYGKDKKAADIAFKDLKENYKYKEYKR